MALNIGRKGWLGVGLEAAYNTPVAPTDYIPFTNETLFSHVKNDDITAAYAQRDKIYASVPTQQYSKGDVEMYLDPKLSGYFFASALGTPITVTSLGSGVFKHYMTRSNSNTPQSLTLISNRTADQVQFAGVAVDQLELDVKDSFATVKAGLIGQFPTDTVTGAITTASGTVFAYPQATFAFGTTVSGAQSASNLKLSEFKLTVKNNAEAVFRHGSATPASINYKEFEASGDMTLFFENTTDRNAYQTSTKQAGSLVFAGATLPGSQQEKITLNFYQLRVDDFTLETGLANFFAEKLKFVCEFNQAIGLTMDATFINQKSVYI